MSKLSGFRSMFKGFDEMFDDTFAPLDKQYADIEPGCEKEIVSTEKKSDGSSIVTTITIKKTVKTIHSTTKKSST